MTYCLAIPTYNRPEALRRCLASVRRQSRLPDSILIIDDASLDPDILTIEKEAAAKRGIFFDYYKKDHGRERRGLSESKNIALERAGTEIIFFLDDDITLHDGFLENIMRRFDENTADDRLLGIGGLIAGARSVGAAEKLYNRLFGLTAPLLWDITPAGFQVWDESISALTRGYYVQGGLCALRRSPALALKFSVFDGGRTGLEDVDFCCRAKQAGYHFLIEPTARADHAHDMKSREGDFLSGQKEGLNRREIFRQTCRHSLANRGLFIRNNIGWVLRQFLAGHFIKGWGMVVGLFSRKS